MNKWNNDDYSINFDFYLSKIMIYSKHKKIEKQNHIYYTLYALKYKLYF